MRTSRAFAVPLAALAVGLAGCGGNEEEEGGTTATNGGEAQQELSGTIRIDGSSTVAPLSEAAAELFSEEQPNVRISVATSGTGGGFERFCRGETDLSDASRAIDEEEVQACEENDITQEQLTVANDALSVVVNPENDWADCLTVEQLNQIWDRGSDVDSWSDVNPDWPDEPLELYGPGTDSGTFDYFTEAVNGEEGVQRTDYNNVGEDDNATVTGVAGSPGGMGYLGFSFVEENQGQIRAVPIENPESGECVEPTEETVQSGAYTPLGRELYVYAKDESLAREEVQEFLTFYIENADAIAETAGYIGLTDEQAQQAQQTIEELASSAGSGSAEAEETPAP